ncbi:MAG: ABC transporter permease subunit [Propionibacteriaceae bacterium]|nr:ABC transporter permease subunit [Propionibacteriaceae bacterium]
MKNLIAAEVLRWLHRWGLWATVVGGLIAAALIGLSMTSGVQPPSEEQVAGARAEYSRYVVDWEANHQAWYDDCVRLTPAGADAQAACADTLQRPVESDWIPQPTRWEDAARPTALLGAVLGGVLALLLGASFWGAEFRHGTLATWLTFAPDRTRVWLAKNLVVLGAGVAASALVTALFLGIETAAFALWQGPGSIGDWSVPLGIALRGLGFGAMAGLMGASLAILFRNTIAAAAVPAAYVVVGLMFNAFVLIPGYEALTVWLPETNLQAYLDFGATYWVRGTAEEAIAQGASGTPRVERTLSFANGLIYLLTLTGGLALAGLVAFQRRDVTD